MDGNIAAEILHTFETHRATKGVVATDKRWKWAAGVLLFPEAICAWCQGTMVSNRIWWVDEHRKKLRSVVAIDEGRLVSQGIGSSHPNVSASGTICVGSAETCYQALFLGWSNANPYWSAGYDWAAKVFDHKCGAKRRVGGLAVEMAVGDAPAKVVAVEAADDEPIFGIRPAVSLPVVDDQRIFGNTAVSIAAFDAARARAATRRQARQDNDDEPIFSIGR